MAHKGGFTLLEVLVAFTIAALALGSLFGAAGFGAGAIHDSGRYEEAISRARSHLAALADGADLAPGETAGDDGGGYRWRITIQPLAQAAPKPGAPAPDPGASHLTLFAVEVGISWSAAGRDREVVLRTRRLGATGG